MQFNFEALLILILKIMQGLLENQNIGGGGGFGGFGSGGFGAFGKFSKHHLF
jgi:hypothetical protein